MAKISEFLLNKKTGKLKLILLYRYFSLAITSIFYLFGQPYSSFLFKSGVITTLLIAALIVKYLLSINEDNPTVLKWIVVTETVGITLLLLPTGGIESPFIWYAINPVLIAASYLSGFFCWGLLLLYMTASSVLSYTFFMEQSVSIYELINQNSYLFLVLMLITIVFQLFGKLTNELHTQAVTLEKQQTELLQINKKLMLTNEKSNEAMEHIMSLYQSVELFTAQDNVHTLVDTILDFSESLTKSTISFCWLSGGIEHVPVYSCNEKEMPQELWKLIINRWNEERESNTPITIEMPGRTLQVISVESTKYQGFIGIEKGLDFTDSDRRILKFLADLSSIMLERFYLEEASNQFLIVEEQNRIANEIHDSVSQRVFGLVYGLHSLKTKLEIQPKDKIMEEIQLLSHSASTAMKELRSSIYQLSTKKRGETLLFSKVEEFLSDVAQLHEISVIPSFEGDEENIPYKLKEAIYRIICEACGNALKHGKCKKLKVTLHIKQRQLSLAIVDDGIGFEPSIRWMGRGSGIGIRNMESLVQSFGGKITFHSKSNQGTNVQVILPLSTQSQEVVGL